MLFSVFYLLGLLSFSLSLSLSLKSPPMPEINTVPPRLTVIPFTALVSTLPPVETLVYFALPVARVELLSIPLFSSWTRG